MNRNTLYYGGSVGVAQIFSFLTLFAYTENLRPEIYALVAIFETVLLLLQSCIGGAIDRGAQRFYLEREPNKVISTSATIGIGGALFLFPLVLSGTLILSQLTPIELSMIYIAALGYILHAIMLVKYQFLGQPKYYFYASMAKTLSFFLSSLFCLYILKMKQEAFLYSGLSSAVFLIIISVWIVKPHYRHLKDIAFVKEMLGYSLPFVPTLLASWCIIWSSRMFMVGHINAQDIGVFSAAQKVAMVFFVFTQAVTLVATPTLFKLLKEDKSIEAIKTMLLNIKILMVVALCISFFLPDILALIVPEGYESVRIYITLMMYVNFISAIMGVSTNILFGFYRKTALQMKVFLVISLLALVMNGTLIPVLGMTGVVLSLLIPITLLLVLHFYFIRESIDISSFCNKVALICIVVSVVFLLDYLLVIEGVGKVFSVLYEVCIMLFLCLIMFRDKLSALLKC